MDAASADAPRPFIGFEGEVDAGWLDVNSHMNVVWYDTVFDMAEAAMLRQFSIHDDYIRATNRTMYRVEKRIRYERELMGGERIRVESRVTATDERLVRHTHELINLTRTIRAATAEYVSIHVDLATRKPARITDPAVLDPLRAFAARHALLPPPGRR